MICLTCLNEQTKFYPFLATFYLALNFIESVYTGLAAQRVKFY